MYVLPSDSLWAFWVLSNKISAHFDMGAEDDAGLWINPLNMRNDADHCAKSVSYVGITHVFATLTLGVINDNDIRSHNRTAVLAPEAFNVFIRPVNKHLHVMLIEENVRRCYTLQHIVELALSDVEHFRLGSCHEPCKRGKCQESSSATSNKFKLTMGVHVYQAVKAK